MRCISHIHVVKVKRLTCTLLGPDLFDVRCCLDHLVWNMHSDPSVNWRQMQKAHQSGGYAYVASEKKPALPLFFSKVSS